MYGLLSGTPDVTLACDRSSDKFQNAMYYAIDGDQVSIFNVVSSLRTYSNSYFKGQQCIYFFNGRVANT